MGVMMESLHSSLGIWQIAASVASIMGVKPPACAHPAMDVLTQKAEKILGGRKAQRVLLYNPDAVALWLYCKYTDLFAPVIARTSAAIPLGSVMPSVTPVCFASMYSGAMPDVHGIQSYTKPVLTVDTLFDALIRAGKKPVIVCTEGDSISRIFLERDMDYFFYPTHEECNKKALELLEEDHYDLIVVYNGNYDTVMHRYAPESREALAELERNSADFARLYDAAKEAWTGYDCMIAYCPDHGCHEIDGGLGSHGLDMPEDMNVVHFFDFLPAAK